jgi:threonine dehydratase
MAPLITLDDVYAARSRIAPAAVRTPLVRLSRERLRDAGFPDLAAAVAEIYLKDESAQPIGSFKLRGAYNKIAQLSAQELRRGVITYSSGNHAQGVAYAARALGAKAVIVMPESAPPIKREATAALGAEIVTVGPASTERRLKAEALAAAHGYTMVAPYDDPAVIAGQATCGLEILEQLPEVDLVLSPVSGGGLLSGVAAGIKLSCEATGRTPPQVWGCEPELAADATESFYTGALTEWPAALSTRTLCDGLRTQSLGQLNFDHILRYVDGILTLNELEIWTALRVILAATGLVAEPSGAIAPAAALLRTARHNAKDPSQGTYQPTTSSNLPGYPDHLPPATRIVAIVSGGNLDPALRSELENESTPTTV